jgi:hypothetical protein
LQSLLADAEEFSHLLDENEESGESRLPARMIVIFMMIISVIKMTIMSLG